MNFFLKIVSVFRYINFNDVGMQVQFATASVLTLGARFHQHHGHLLSLFALCSAVYDFEHLLSLPCCCPCPFFPSFCIHQQMFTLLCAPHCGYILGWSSFPQGNQTPPEKENGSCRKADKASFFLLLKVQQPQPIFSFLNNLGMVMSLPATVPFSLMLVWPGLKSRDPHYNRSSE